MARARATGTKVRSTCEEVKPLSGFHRQAAAWDGRQSICKACRRDRDPLVTVRRKRAGIAAGNAAEVGAGSPRADRRGTALRRRKWATIAAENAREEGTSR